MLVSVVIPAYNAAKTITRAINSVLAQSYHSIEVIVVDDGSNDDTTECLKSFGKNVSLISQANKGVSAARNRGVQAAKGEWIAFLDADDEWHPRKLEFQIQYLNVLPNLILISTSDVIVRTGQNIAFCEVKEKPKYSLWKHKMFLRRNDINASSVLVNRKAYETFGGFDEALINGEDRDLWLRLLYNGVGINVDFPFTKYHHTGGSLSHNVVRRFNCDLTLIERWDNRISGSLDVSSKVPAKEFCKIKYAVMFTMVFKLLRLEYVEDAKVFWQKLCSFHKKEYPFVPCIPWLLFIGLARMEKIRKQIKYGKA
jgi:glycosyltransferase involved in cell wall biosynthesis